jgi:hypothetical protein
MLIKFLIALRVRFLKCPNNTFGRIQSINIEDSFLEKKKFGSITCKDYISNDVWKFLTDLQKIITMTPTNSISATKIVQAPLTVLLSTACVLELQRPTRTEAACEYTYVVNESSAIVFCYDANRRVKTLEHSRFKAIWTVRSNGDTQICSFYGKNEGKKKALCSSDRASW